MVAARAEVEGREAVIAKGLADANPRVRYEALQTWGRASPENVVRAVLPRVRDTNPHVSLLAIDLLGNGCPGTAAADRHAAGAGEDDRTGARAGGTRRRTPWSRSRKPRRPRRASCCRAM